MLVVKPAWVCARPQKGLGLGLGLVLGLGLGLGFGLGLGLAAASLLPILTPTLIQP